MIYFLCPDLPYPTGGVKQIHLQASYLLDAGHEVVILYTGNPRPRFWFASRVPCRFASSWLTDHTTWRQKLLAPLRYLVRNSNRKQRLPRLKDLDHPLSETDLLVVPEIYATRLEDLPVNVPKLILNQNCFLSFHGVGISSVKYDCSVRDMFIATGVIGVLANSPYGEAYLRWAFPGLTVRTLHLAVDIPLVVPELRDRKPLLVYFPRKSGDVLEQLIGSLNNRGALAGWTLQPLEGLSGTAVQDLFKQARLFIAASVQEGLGLPPLEAMASGCVVVGFPAWGGDAYLTEDVSCQVQTGDVLALAQVLEKTLRSLLADPNSWQRQVSSARLMIQESYSHARAAASTQAEFSYFLKQ